MDMHRKKRIEIILEAPAMNRLSAALEAAGVTGYTVLPVLAGKGKTGAWTRDGLVGARAHHGRAFAPDRARDHRRCGCRPRRALLNERDEAYAGFGACGGRKTMTSMVYHE
jgi:hypothetical protein